MLYRVMPTGQITWNDLPSSIGEDLVEEGFDLDQLEWKPVEESHRLTDVIAIALRYGIKTTSGIAFKAHYLVRVERPLMLRESFADLERSSTHPQIKATDQLMESIAPGWIEHGERLDERVKESSAASIRDADEKAQKILDAPVDPVMLDWWQWLGGPVF